MVGDLSKRDGRLRGRLFYTKRVKNVTQKTRVAGWGPRHAPGRREGRGAGAHPLILNMYQPGGALL